jgi:hypothetical protein
MFDIVAPYFSQETIRCAAVWTLASSALIIFFLAFAVTTGAGFRCPLALLRGAQRLFLCALSISAAYAAAYIVSFSWTPPGPVLILFVAFLVATLISGVRHLMAPAISADNTWSGAWRLIHDKMVDHAPLAGAGPLGARRHRPF